MRVATTTRSAFPLKYAGDDMHIWFREDEPKDCNPLGYGEMSIRSYQGSLLISNVTSPGRPGKYFVRFTEREGNHTHEAWDGGELPDDVEIFVVEHLEKARALLKSQNMLDSERVKNALNLMSDFRLNRIRYLEAKL